MPGPVAGSQDLPTLACYISQDHVTWLSVSFDSGSGLACGMNKNSAGMNVVMVGAPPGWYYYFALTYVPAS